MNPLWIKNAEKEDVIGLVAPHAGYIYSGAVAGAVLSRVKFKDTFIILGPIIPAGASPSAS